MSNVTYSRHHRNGKTTDLRFQPAMALQQREICQVGESPSTRRRAPSPRRGSGPDENPVQDEPPKTPTASTSISEVRSPSKAERRVSTRLLMQQKGGGGDSPTKNGGKSPKHAAWKTSKFFSRSMASGELLKGFGKKLSGTSAAATVVASACGEGDGAASTSSSVENKESDSSAAKSFVSRFSSLRRKSGSDTDTVPKVDSETLQVFEAHCSVLLLFASSSEFIKCGLFSLV